MTYREPSDGYPPSMEKCSNERGLLATEIAVLMPAMLLIALLAVYVVHVERHSSRAQQAADAAARAGSLYLTEPEARVAAQAAAEAVCNGTVVITDDKWDYAPAEPDLFTPGRVAVSLTCIERFSAFAPLMNDVTRTESGVAVAAIEYWRPGT